jgi:hypothetical protein
VRCGTGNGSSGAFGPLGPGVPGAMRNDPNEARACGFAEKRRAMLRSSDDDLWFLCRKEKFTPYLPAHTRARRRAPAARGRGRPTDETAAMSSAHALRALPRVTPDRPRVAADRSRASSSRSRVAFRAKATTRDAPFEDDDDLTYADLAEEEARLISANAKKYDGPGAVLGVSRAFAVQVSEKAVKEALPGRGVLEYVRLPAEEYNVLDSDAVTRVGEHTFRVAAGAQKILWLEVEPVGVITIRPTEDGCEQILLGATMADAKARRTGGKENGIVAAMNASLRDLRMCNRISATYGEDAVRTPSSRPDTISCQIDIGGTFTEGPVRRSGQRPSERRLAMVPRRRHALVPESTRERLRRLVFKATARTAGGERRGRGVGDPERHEQGHPASRRARGKDEAF